MWNKLKHYIKEIKRGRLKEMMNEAIWLWQYVKPHILSVVLYTCIGLSGIAVSLISSLVSRDLVDIITGHKVAKLISTFCSMIGVTLGSTFIGQASNYISTKINIKVDNQMKAMIFDDIMTTEWEALSKYRSGDILMRWNSDVTIITNGVLSLVPNFIISLFQFISALVMVIYYDASFAVFALVSVPISIFISGESLKRMRKNNMSSISINTQISSFNQETFSNIETVKAFDMLSFYSKRLRNLQREYAGIRLKYQKTAIVNSIILTILSMIVSYSAQGWGVYKVWSGAISYGTMVMFLTLSTTLSGATNNLINLVPNTILLTNSTKRLRDIMSMPKEDYSQKNEVEAFYEKNKSSGIGIFFKDVSYTYPNGTDVFAHASMEAYPHEIIALVGPSGEGKTTMIRFILSLIHAQEGQGYICSGKAFLDNCSTSMPLTASVRQLCAYVPQGNTMFYGTIAENMRNVKENATDEEIINALRIACAWDFVSKLPDGINSQVNERGGGFSEGQSQRLSIARAVLRHSPILLLDEATSALDIMTEKRVLENLMEDQYPRTSIITTHRPSVLRMCDRVYSIQDKQCVILSKEQIEELINC